MANLFTIDREYQALFHMRCTPAMKAAILGHGGARWMRALVQANLAAPFTATPTPGEFAAATPTADLPAKRVTRHTPAIVGNKPRTKKVRRVTLDKRKRRTVK